MEFSRITNDSGAADDQLGIQEQAVVTSGPDAAVCGDSPGNGKAKGVQAQIPDGERFELKYHNAEVDIVVYNGEFIVLKGSTAKANMVESNSAKSQRDELLRSNKLSDKGNGLLEFVEDVTFKKPSPIVLICTGTTVSAGRTIIHVASRLTLEEYQQTLS